MFKIVYLDGKQEMPKDDIYYIVAKDGIFLRKKLGLIESLTPVKEISILENAKPYASMSIPKIPGKSMAKVMKFFKKAYQLYSSEAIVLLYFNPTTKTYRIYIPHQKVNGASVDYVKGVHLDNHIQVGTIHSHANFSAFHSGTDDNDEEHFDGLHITIGNNMDSFPSISASIVSNGMRFKVAPNEYIDNLDIVEYTPYFPHMFRPAFTEINGVKEYTNTVKSTLSYKLNVTLDEKDFNEKWIEKIEDDRPVYTRQNWEYGSGYYGNLYTKFDYQDKNSKEDGTLTWYQQKFGFGKKNKKNKNKNKYCSDDFKFPFKVKGFEKQKEPIVYTKPKYDPCETCVFKKYKHKEDLKEEEKKVGVKEIIVEKESDIAGIVNV